MGTPCIHVSRFVPSKALDWTYTLGESSLEHGDNILALNAINIKALGPSLQDTFVNVVLRGWVGKGETQRQCSNVLAVTMMSFEELVKTVGNVLPELIALASLELLGHLVLGLNDVELGLLFGEGDLADAKVGAAHVEG